MPQDKMHLAPLRLSRQEIDTYIVQARERSYEMMVRFGKRGLNLAATAAVQAATKVPGMGMGCWVSPRMLRPRGSGRKFPPQCGCSWWCHSPAWCDGITLGVPSALLFALGGLISILSIPSQSQGALAGRLRSFSMQDLRSIPDETPIHYQDPLYLEEQENRRQLLGEPGGNHSALGLQ